MRKILKILFYLFIVILTIFGSFLLYATVDDYKPDEKIVVYDELENADTISDTLKISLMLWNIGYCGLNAEMDFFYDGGEKTRPEKEIVERNIAKIKNYLQKYNDIDFYLFQEVDKKSNRSYKFNEYDTISSIFPKYNAVYAKNYDVFFVPQPISSPMGSVNSGLMTLSKYAPSKATRYSFPGNYQWPIGIFFLDRCFLVNRYNINNGKELIIINIHNSAYDDGSLKQQQMEYLKIFLVDEFKKGNYVIVGGDWNQCPPNFSPNFKEDIMDNESRTDINENYLKKWTWLYYNMLPTNRRLKINYQKGKTLTTVIDYYLLSPNIEALYIKNIDFNFKYSDHQPVKAIIKLK